MDVSDVHSRFKILQAVYRQGKAKNSDTYRLLPELLGYNYADMNYHLRYMKSRGFLDYSPRMLMRSYTITILPPGKEVVETFEAAFFSEDPQRETQMKEALNRLK